MVVCGANSLETMIAPSGIDFYNLGKIDCNDRIM